MDEKERKYMESHRIVEISNLSQFIDLINTLPSDRYSYRGESALYYERTSSAIRPYDGTQDSAKEYPYEKMIKDYYYETSHVLSDMERTNFMAFAQHYGIPTNLVDISFSPLVALFFACSPKNRYEYEKRKTDRTGYVYFLRTDGIDITSVIEKDPFVNVVRELTDDRNPHFAELSKLIQDYYVRHQEECIEDLSLVIQQILLLGTADTKVEKRRYEAVLMAVKNWDERETAVHAEGMFQHMFGEDWSKLFGSPGRPSIFWWYVAFVRAYLIKLLTHRKRVYYFDFL
ncbi:MAG TPA: FRG domain-containing protein, partial [Clostridiaceae bacterium]|nr:FRG domain-containing protein [Clostridiaceae bacterium]